MRRRSRVGVEVVLGVREEVFTSGTSLLAMFNVEVDFTWPFLCSVFLEMLGCNLRGILRFHTRAMMSNRIRLRFNSLQTTRQKGNMQSLRYSITKRQ